MDSKYLEIDTKLEYMNMVYDVYQHYDGLHPYYVNLLLESKRGYKRIHENEDEDEDLERSHIRMRLE